MQRKNNRRQIKRIAAGLLALTLAATLPLVSFAEETKEEASTDATQEEMIEESAADTTAPLIKNPDDAKNGIVQVNCVYTSDAGVEHVICGGTGFLVGDADNSQHVITCNHIIALDEEERETAFSFLDIEEPREEWNGIDLDLQVVMENDIVTMASVVKSSKELDLAVLKLSEPIRTRTPLTILTADGNDPAKLPYKVTDKIYALGYPESIWYDSELFYYGTDQVTMSTGSIVNLAPIGNVQMIEHDAQIGDNNSGGPLVDAAGRVIGMNVPARDGNYYCSVDSTAICKVLDAVGIGYARVTSSDLELARKRAEEEEQAAKEQEASEAEIPDWLMKAFAALLGLVVVLIILLIIFLIRGNKKTPEEKARKKQEKIARKKAKANAKIKTPELPDAIRNQDVSKQAEQISGGMDTSLLSAGSDTTLLGKGGAPGKSGGGLSGTLIRHKTGENIVLSKNVFVIGKDSLHVDYYIKDNSAISRKHAEIKAGPDGAYIDDCHSTNGTFVNNKKVTEGHPQLLSSGDVIRLANEEFDYRV